MALPDNDGELQPGELQISIARSRDGNFVGFRDPATGQFMSRAEAVPRLRYNVERGELEDSFGEFAGVGSIRMPERGVEVGYVLKVAAYKPLDTSPLNFRPAPNQELVEHIVFVDAEGKLITLETSFGLGKRYEPNLYGGRWRQAASEALGVADSKRLPTKDLERAVVQKYYSVKTIE